MARRKIEEKNVSKDCVLYARVSSKEQEREGYSIDAQVRLLREYAQKSSLRIIEEYIDVESAKTSSRQNFSKMLEFFKLDAKLKDESHRCRILLVEKTDRLYRNIKDWTTMDDYDLQIHLVKEGEVLGKESKSQSKFMHGIRVLMAKNYIDNLSEEVLKGMIEKARKGIYPGKAPLGYVNVECGDTKLIQVDPYYGPIIRRLFERYSTGNFSLKEITNFIEEEGLVYKKSGAKVHKSVIYTTLTNPIYYGEFLFRGEQYKGSHEPLISRDLFDQVQSVLKIRGKNKTKIQKHNWAFQGLIRCGHCDSALTAEIKRKSTFTITALAAKGRVPNKNMCVKKRSLASTANYWGRSKLIRMFWIGFWLL
ncbi:MAG: recombinase family protein [Bdellovibrionales bacterium]|nr:recombinase family protein [Bdellovibrionales bacterium]